jgi:hypothetical protein
VTLQRHGPYRRVDLTERELELLRWCIKTAAESLGDRLQGPDAMARRTRGLAELEELGEYLTNARSLAPTEANRVL